MQAQNQQWQGRMEGEIQGIDKAAASTKNELSNFERQESNAQSRLTSEVGALDSAIVLGEQRVEKSLTDETKTVQGNSGKQLGGMETLLGEYGSTKATSEGAIGKMEGDFKD